MRLNAPLPVIGPPRLITTPVPLPVASMATVSITWVVRSRVKLPLVLIARVPPASLRMPPPIWLAEVTTVLPLTWPKVQPLALLPVLVRLSVPLPLLKKSPLPVIRPDSVASMPKPSSMAPERLVMSNALSMV
ncbi:hypothetical protein D9M68_339960 [compost metagenome]